MFGILVLSGYAFALLSAMKGTTPEKGEDEYGRNRGGGKGQRFDRKRTGKKERKNKSGGSSEESEGQEEASEYEDAVDQIDLEFDVAQIGDDVADSMFEEPNFDDEDEEEFGVFPGPPTGADVLRSAGLAQPGSWTERNVLAAGAKDAWSRRVAGNETEADYAVLRAARPGIASSASGPISPAWTKAPWPGSGGESTETEDDDISSAVLKDMGL